MGEGKVTLESELNNWFDDYVHQRLIDGAVIGIEERVINKYYVKKEDVLTAIGEYEENDDPSDFHLEIRDKLRAEIKLKLNLGDK